jgi:hypothetical protein
VVWGLGGGGGSGSGVHGASHTSGPYSDVSGVLGECESGLEFIGPTGQRSDGLGVAQWGEGDPPVEGDFQVHLRRKTGVISRRGNLVFRAH